MAIGLFITSKSGTTDVTQLVQTITWSGDYQQCARTLNFGLTSSPTDKSIPTIQCDLGNIVELKLDDRVLFSGYIFERQKDTGSSVIDITCFDRGIYLKRNEAVYKFSNMTPEAIAHRVCTDFGISLGSVAETGVKISHNFVGVTLYQIIQTAYTRASDKNGDKYQIRFDNDKLCVIKKEITNQTLLIEGGSNLMSASTSESITDMVNQVAIYNSDDKPVGDPIKNDSLISLYGLLQSYYRKSDNEDTTEKAKQILEDSGVKQKITIENLGNAANVTGGTVVVHEPYTGTYGVFYIDSDTHTWKKGLYLNKLVLNFKCLMDEQEAGEIAGR